MPAIFTLVTAWLFRTFVPYVFFGLGFIVAYIFGWLENLIFWILVQFLTLAESFVSFVADGTSLFDTLTFDAIPAEFMVFVGFLKAPAAFGVILTAYAIRLVRKIVLRF